MLARPFFAPLLLTSAALVVAGCTSSLEGGGMGPPDDKSIYVFFPSGADISNGLVRGRGLAGAMPDEATHAQVRSYPSGHSDAPEVAPDGSFEFNIIAISGDVLEIRGALSSSGDGLGAPIYVRVPITVTPPEEFVCCVEENTCQPISEREIGVPCDTLDEGVRSCEDDLDCKVFENEYHPLDPNAVSITAPDAAGNVVVEGQLLPNMLIKLENVGKRAVGTGLTEDERRKRGLLDPGVRLSRITDDEGRFRFDRVPAIADDELILQLEDLRGYTSPQYAARVPDPPLAGVDVLGVFPWSPLTNGEPGTLAIRLSPYGTDGRGICPDWPDPDDGLELCVGGGFAHEMITGFTRAEVDFGSNSDFPLVPVETATDANTPFNRGLEGNVRSAGLDLFIVLDMSADAALGDADRNAFEAVRSYVRYLRARDRVGLITYGPATTVEVGLTNDRRNVDAALSRLTTQPRGGENKLLDGVRVAATALDDRGSSVDGRIVVITFGPPAGPPLEARDELDQVLDIVERRPLAAFAGFPVDVVGVPVPGSADTLRVLEDLAVFSQGTLVSAPSATQLGQTLADLRGEQVGTFILLYDLQIPEAAGKAGTIRLDFRVSLEGEVRDASYEGPLPIANAPNP